MKKASFAVLLLLNFFAMTSSATTVAEASEERKVLRKIHSARTLTGHLSIGYDMGSARKMARSLHPGDVPVLIRLHNQNRDRMAVEKAIVTQCGAALDGLAGLDAKDAVMNITGAMSRSGVCDAAARERAKEWYGKLVIDLENRIKQTRSNATESRD